MAEMTIEEFIDRLKLNGPSRKIPSLNDGSLAALVLIEYFCRRCVDGCYGGHYVKEPIPLGSSNAEGFMEISFWDSLRFYLFWVVYDQERGEWRFNIMNSSTRHFHTKSSNGDLVIDGHVCDKDWLILVKKAINLICLAFDMQAALPGIIILNNPKEWLTKTERA